MGLTLFATGFPKDMNTSYGAFTYMRLRIAEAYSQKHGELYGVFCRNAWGLPQDFWGEWEQGNNEALDILLWHSDCDGKLTYQECGKIYNALKSLHVEDEDTEGSFYNDFVEMLKHCRKRRVNMYFS